MTKNDQVVIATVVTNAIQATVPNMIKEVVQDLLEQNNHLLKREIRDEIYSANKALENQLRRDFRSEMQQMRLDIYSDMQKIRVEIVTDIGEILDQSILLQITNLDHRVFKIENQLATC